MAMATATMAMAMAMATPTPTPTLPALPSEPHYFPLCLSRVFTRRVAVAVVAVVVGVPK